MTTTEYRYTSFAKWSLFLFVVVLATEFAHEGWGQDVPSPVSLELLQTSVIRFFWIALISGSVLFLVPIRRGLEASDRSCVRPWAAVVGLMVIAYLLRWPGILTGLWRDEASSYFHVIQPLSSLFDVVRVSELNPPFYFFLLRVWETWFGHSEVSLKLPSLIAGVALVGLAFVLGRASHSNRAGIIAASLVAVSPEAIIYAQEARPYSLAALLAMSVTALYLHAVLYGSRLLVVCGVMLIGAAGLYTQYTFLLLVITLVCGSLLFAAIGRLEQPVWPVLLGLLGALVLFFPWVGNFLEHLEIGMPWTAELQLWRRPILAIKLIAHIFPWPSYNRFGDALAFLVVLVAAICVVRGFLPKIEPEGDRRRRIALAVLAAAFLFPAFMMAYLSIHERYMFAFLPIGLVFLAILTTRAIEFLLPETRFRPAVLLTIILFAGVGIAGWWSHQAIDEPKSGMRSLAQDLTPDAVERSIYLIAPDYLAPTFAYYAGDRGPEFIGFGRIDKPHIFRPAGYLGAWSNPALVEQTIERLNKSQAQGKDRFVLLLDRCGARIGNSGLMPYAKVSDLTARLDKAFARDGDEQTYPGSMECIAMRPYRLD